MVKAEWLQTCLRHCCTFTMNREPANAANPNNSTPLRPCLQRGGAVQRRAVRKGTHVWVGAAGQPRAMAFERAKCAVAVALIGALLPQAAAEEAFLHAGRQASAGVAAAALERHPPALVASAVVRTGAGDGNAPARLWRHPAALHGVQGGRRAAAGCPLRRPEVGPLPSELWRFWLALDDRLISVQAHQVRLQRLR